MELPDADAGAVAVAVAVKGLAVALTQAGHEVTLVTVASRRAPAEEVVDGVRVLRANAELPWLPDDDVVTRAASANHQLVQLALLARDRLPDVIHAHDWRVAWAADTLSTALRVPLVATFHSTEWGLHAGRVPPGTPATVPSVESGLGHRADNVATSTRFMLREVTDGFELDPARVHLIPNGIDPSWWTPTSDPPGERRPLVFAWGRVHYEKGFQVLARAINLLRSRVPGIECHIGGRGSYLPELQFQSTWKACPTSRSSGSSPTSSCARSSPRLGASPCRPCTSRSASSPSRPWPAARRSSSRGPAAWPSATRGRRWQRRRCPLLGTPGRRERPYDLVLIQQEQRGPGSVDEFIDLGFAVRSEAFVQRSADVSRIR